MATGVNLERRLLRDCELRAEPESRRLTGVVMQFGDVAPTYRERFEPGAFTFAEAVPLNLMHNPLMAVAWAPGGGLTLEADETALRMIAEVPNIPAGNVALAMVRDGKAQGLSIEFNARSERRETGVRVVEIAELRGIGLVRDPSYKASRVEARAAGRRLPIWL